MNNQRHFNFYPAIQSNHSLNNVRDNVSAYDRLQHYRTLQLQQGFGNSFNPQVLYQNIAPQYSHNKQFFETRHIRPISEIETDHKRRFNYEYTLDYLKYLPSSQQLKMVQKKRQDTKTRNNPIIKTNEKISKKLKTNNNYLEELIKIDTTNQTDIQICTDFIKKIHKRRDMIKNEFTLN